MRDPWGFVSAMCALGCLLISLALIAGPWPTWHPYAAGWVLGAVSTVLLVRQGRRS